MIVFNHARVSAQCQIEKIKPLVAYPSLDGRYPSQDTGGFSFFIEDNMGFTKLDSGIIDSSIWAEPLATRVVWVTFLAKANYHGIVKAARSGMIRASNVTEKEFDKATQKLEAPDPESRSPEFEGRRIEKIEGGWLVLNYQKYREYSYSDSPEAIRQRRHREKERDGALHVTKQRDISASASASASASEDKKNGLGRLFEEFWQAYPKEGRFHKKACLQRFASIVKADGLDDLKAGFAGYMDHLKDEKLNKHFDKQPMHMMTFMNKERYLTYKGFKYEPGL